MKKTVAYIRVSTKKQEIVGYSVEAQHISLQEFAKRNSFSIVKEFIDIESAKEPGRLNFDAMIKFIRKDRTIKHVIADSMDRISRNVHDFSAIVRLIEEEDITLHTAKENGTYNKNSPPWEQYIEGQKVLAAKLDNDIRAMKVKGGMLQKAEGGRYPSRAPFGYKNCEKYGKRDIAPDPDTAPYVVQMFELYSTGNYSVATLREEMVSKGMVYRNGNPPHRSEIAKILKHRFYLGEFMWKGKLYKDASHKAIISEELFNRVQNLIIKPGKQKSRRSLFAYTGSIVCGTCGSGITAEIKKERYIYYHCTGAKGGCDEDSIREEFIEEQVCLILKNIAIPDEMHGIVCAAIKESMQKQIEYHAFSADKIKKQLKALQDRIDRAYMDKLDEKIDEVFWSAQDKKLKAQKEQLSSTLLEHQGTQAEYLKQVDRMLELPKSALQIFKRGNVEQKHAIFNLLFSKCVLTNKTLHFELNEPFDQFIKYPIQPEVVV